MSNFQPASEAQGLIFPKQGHLGANGLHIPDYMEEDRPWSQSSSMTFFKDETDHRMTLTLLYTHLDKSTY